MFLAPLIRKNESLESSPYMQLDAGTALKSDDHEINARLKAVSDLFSVCPIGDAGLGHGAVIESISKLVMAKNGVSRNAVFTAIKGALVYPTQNMIFSLTQFNRNESFSNNHSGHLQLIERFLTSPDIFEELSQGVVDPQMQEQVDQIEFDYKPRPTDLYLITSESGRKFSKGEVDAEQVVADLVTEIKHHGIFTQPPTRQDLTEHFFKSQGYSGMPPFTESFFYPKTERGEGLGDVFGWANLTHSSFEGSIIVRDDKAMALKIWSAARGQPKLAACG